jgi:hypothetical protein
MPSDEPVTEAPPAAVPAPRSDPSPPMPSEPAVPSMPAETSGPAEPSGSAAPQLTPLVPSTPPAAVVRRAQAGSRAPLWLAIVVGAVSLLCVAALGFGYHYYNKATTPNRSAPDVVVDNYLRAVLVDQDNSEAGQYLCGKPTTSSTLTTFRNQFVSREKSLGGTATFSWGPLKVARSGSSQALVTVDLVVVTTGGTSLPGKSVHEWLFTTVDQSGWRVCGAVQQS